jgi:hypothetical protein
MKERYHIMKVITMKIITTTDSNLPRILYADKIEPATLKPGYIILDECRTIALADVIAIVPVGR